MKVIEHVYKNSDYFDINPNQISVSGVNAGAWICFGACTLLAKEDKAYMVKAQFLRSPMLSN